jgi:hypothetical protein
VLAHAQALLTSHEAGATEYIDADLRGTSAILSQAGQVLDFTRPVAEPAADTTGRSSLWCAAGRKR